ncbi:SigE family RNA polymerase sigma factor [Streptomyces sp. NBC_01304]|uniref:SigE family RNA polymerase sigma factor n=1 Tax=Streptomyces sp. NBC_01304 TaxID=2903818 RepID=UPI002E1070D5|nr:SigE family RNA polymerase sigma factor [Streptomyces sp. NBC_01304]
MRGSDQQLQEFQDFATTHGPRLFRTGLLLTGGDWHRAEDLVQTAFSKAFVAWGRVRRTDSPDAYVRTVLVRAHLSERRLRRSGERPVAEVPEGAYGEGDPTLRVALLGALAQLPRKDRAVLVLRYWEDRSVEQTAAELGLRTGTVRNRSSSALAKLRVLLGSERDALTTT